MPDDDGTRLKEYIEKLEAVASTVSKLSSVSSPALIERWRVFIFGIFCGFKSSSELSKLYEVAGDALIAYGELVENFPEFETYVAKKTASADL